ncbi:uncharacterized protein VTP21DRAFT_6847 [Calcarisporiella thermophila]|uniref:uncharacterized protein n=1 Tax=Calcarisporiella thermophila TaxID=911321 RepID=UPI0037433176
MSNSSFELQFFGPHGRNSITRAILSYAGVNWKDRDVGYPEEWLALKETAPYGHLPVLYEHKSDGTTFVLSETSAINQYLASKFGLIGSNEEETARITAISSHLDNILNAAVTHVFAAEAGLDPIKTKEALDKAIRHNVKYHERLLAENGGNGFYVGNKLSYVDIFAAVLYSNSREFNVFKDVPKEQIPLFTKVVENVYNEPRLKEFWSELIEKLKE